MTRLHFTCLRRERESPNTIFKKEVFERSCFERNALLENFLAQKIDVKSSDSPLDDKNAIVDFPWHWKKVDPLQVC